ncbi:Asp-tRNA(Asn)/Glu-tRNA(Gln) amidotransferase subunit GatC [Spirochaeta dissipatitropha]
MITDKDILVTAGLAQVELSEDEREALRASMSRMVEYMEVMAEAPVDELLAMTHVHAAENRIRNDNNNPWNNTDALLENAEDLEDRYIAIPNVL